MALKSYMEKGRIEAGCDEAGRGCLAGPVVAASVILDPKRPIRNLNDSKKLTEKARMAFKQEIEERALAWSVTFVAPSLIDKINILKASFHAMNLAVNGLSVRPEHLLIDGNRFYNDVAIPFSCVIKGDGKYQSIAAASILAKTYRDLYMKEQGELFPGYGWESNKGYPSKAHREAIRANGVTPLHRRSFQLLPAQLDLFTDA